MDQINLDIVPILMEETNLETILAWSLLSLRSKIAFFFISSGVKRRSRWESFIGDLCSKSLSQLALY